ncbi:unnamed protein product [Moneuplotes crassus]|uniref:Uncharacterized protein n=1 Tax=Euplotes crassus TaxID=5936 RepID=A0AAD1TZ48_EUPCR|nr:unnamed protein product [Moneuplotes crassus]
MKKHPDGEADSTACKFTRPLAQSNLCQVQYIILETEEYLYPVLRDYKCDYRKSKNFEQEMRDEDDKKIFTKRLKHLVSLGCIKLALILTTISICNCQILVKRRAVVKQISQQRTA